MRKGKASGQQKEARKGHEVEGGMAKEEATPL
jgi:hypothetical protein